ncbi:MAG TPA: ATP-binding cassette domain-containing protein [Gemmatimonadota bacterium]|nr:ATP-binding cassette domain-containing protein [Gemmatimonadota bacterium]
MSFAVSAGELFGLLGPNGGGKTTTLQVLATLLRPTGGAARVCGADVVAEAASVRRRIGVVFQHPALDLRLTPLENLRHHGHLYGLRGAELARRSEELLSRLGVADRGRDRISTLSAGLRRRVEIAKGLLHRPELLLLDEPTAGLDPGGRRDVWDTVASLRAAEGITVLATTHLMDEAERCDRIGILDRGALAALGTPEELKGGIRGDVISLAAEDPGSLAGEIRGRFGGEVAVVDGAVRIERKDGAALVPRLAEAFPGAIRSITVGQPTLEDVFLQRTGHRFSEEP